MPEAASVCVVAWMLASVIMHRCCLQAERNFRHTQLKCISMLSRLPVGFGSNASLCISSDLI